MHNTFKIRLYTGFTLAILLCVISGITSYLLLQKQQSQRVWVRKARRILDTTSSIQNQLIEMSNSRSEFRGTNQQQFLEPYYNGLKRIRPAIDTLKNLVSDDPEVGNIETLLSQHIEDLLGFWNNNGSDAVHWDRDYVAKLTDDEKTQMKEIRSLITELQKDETKLLNKRREEHDQIVHYATLSTNIDSILSLLIILILVYFIIREFNSRRKIQEQLHALVEQLKSQAEVLQKSEAELKHTSTELGTINAQLEKFVYTVAHDIKSPLSGIVGALEIIRSDEAVMENRKLTQFADLSSDAALHLAHMVDFLLEYSRTNISQQATEPVDTKQLLDQLVVLLFPPKNIQIFVDEKMPVLNTRKLKIIQVFQNLISNAIKYNDKDRGVIDIGYKDRGSHYEFFVKDNGQGIPAANKEKMFNLFRTSGNKSANDSSTGFGLNIVKLIVEEQGGKIWYDSVEGNGTTFYFDWMK